MDAVEGGRERLTASARRRQRAAIEQNPSRGRRRRRGGIQLEVAPPPPPIAPPANVPAGHVPNAEGAHVVDAPEDAPAAAVWDGIRPLLGGPVDESLFISFRTHVATQIWVNRDYRGVMRPHCHAKILEPPLALTQIIERTRLTPLVTCSFRWSHKALVTAFVERWQLETNTFHMPFGEITITLDNVATILGIPVIGKVVSCPKLDDAVAQDLLVSTLGVEDSDASLALRDVRGQSVKLSWLKTIFSNLGDAPTVEKTTYAARAYLLYLLSSTLFTDKSGGRVSVGLLYVLQDLDTVHEYGWGAAALATLYRHLVLGSSQGSGELFITFIYPEGGT
ncbi:hypothetical protein L1049_010888 [Liquidambar formosana]|uniref:Aminotransferase-like plant mobile domain-containing protein n=1 Tax=Liquidambar formosana TaxID=63359 RepID=A0AAP0X1J4_LIQFO